MGHDAARANDRALANGHPRGNLDVAAQPAVLANVDGLAVAAAANSLLRIGGVVGGIKAHVGAQQSVLADGDLGAVQDHATKVDVDVVFDVDVGAKLALEIGLDPNTLANRAKELAHKLFSQLFLVVVRGVVGAKELLCLDAAIEEVLVKVVVNQPLLEPFPGVHRSYP